MTAHREATHRETVGLSTLASELLEAARQHDSHRAARTVASGLAQRATVIALAEGAELAEHEAPVAATVQVLMGRARLATASREWLLGATELMPVPSERHSLHAVTDTAVLLTVALR